MDECVVESSVEDGLLVGCAALDAYAPQVTVPLCCGLGTQLVERLALLLGFEVHACILYGYERYAHAHGYLFAFAKVVVAEAVAYVVTGYLAMIVFI